MDAPTGPLWSQQQAIAYEVALEAINDVIAGYSEQIALEQARPSPNTARIAWLEMRTDRPFQSTARSTCAMTATCSRRFPNLAPLSAQGMKGADPIAPVAFHLFVGSELRI